MMVRCMCGLSLIIANEGEKAIVQSFGYSECDCESPQIEMVWAS